MGCACKNGKNEEINSVKINETNLLVRIFNFLLIFVLMIIITPFLFCGVLVLVFNQTVLNKENKISDIVKTLLFFKEKLTKKNDNEENEDDNELDENYFDDLEIIGIERVEKKNE